jgi:hypothetical protein
MEPVLIQQRFSAALDALVGQVREDRSILAAILCGSLSHDTVWAKSDIDLVLVTVDDKKVERSCVALNADGVNVHAMMLPRADFRKTVEGSLHSSFMHSFLAKGRLLYTHDETIAGLFDRLRAPGDRDAGVQRLRAASEALGSIHKAHKWLLTRGDLNYAALWILYSATPLAQIEMIDAGLVVDREVIPQAARLNPRLFEVIYTRLLNEPKSRQRVQAALDAVDGHLAARAPALFATVIEHLREAGEARSSKEIDDHFAKHCGIEDVTVVCEYLADQGLIGKASTPVRLTRRSNVEVQELAFFFLDQEARAR